MTIIWDWNGTLLDDTVACVEALNEMLTKRGRAPLTLEFFREHFAFPARKFYSEIGMDVPDSEWDALAWEYHECYLKQPSIRLNEEAIAALEAVRARGARQVVLSALHQDLLEADLERFGIRSYFDRVVGSDNYDGGSKLARGRELVRELRTANHASRATLHEPQTASDESRIVLIGDSLHDHEVATALGVDCVLVSTGGHSFPRLQAVAPTATSLLSALKTL